MRDIIALMEWRDLFMVLIGAGMVIGLFFIFSAVHDGVWLCKNKDNDGGNNET